MDIKGVSLKISVMCSLFLVCPAGAWGERGHHVICEVATRLVENPNLKNFLRSRHHVMGHLCNIPDTWWRSFGPVAKVGDSGHYLNPDKLGLSISEVPLQYSSLFEKTFETPEGKKTAESLNFPEYFGSLWWRGDQFYRVGLNADRAATRLPLPRRDEQQKNDLAYNQAVFEMMESMGIMGHFVGDASMPYHTDGDYDGWAGGHGGIHAFYESQSVDHLDLDLPAKVYDVARKDKSFKNLKSGAEPLSLLVLKKLSELSQPEKAEIEKLDPIIKDKKLQQEASAVASLDPFIKVPPKREGAEVGAKKFKPLIIKQLGRSAQALAVLWDSFYVEAGKPDLSPYRSYRYPLKPDFVVPDYLPRPTGDQKKP